jgi:CBS domain-containing protein
VIGILSKRDIVRALADRDAGVLKEAKTVDSIMKQMTAEKVRHVPVVEQEQLVGIVSNGDVVEHRFMHMECESEALHDYIQKA